MLCCLELGDGVVDFSGLDEELKRSGDSISGKEEMVSNRYSPITVQLVIKYDRKYFGETKRTTGSVLMEKPIRIIL